MSANELIDFARIGAAGNPVVARSAIDAIVANKNCGTVIIRLRGHPNAVAIVEPAQALVDDHPDLAARAVALRILVVGLVYLRDDAKAGGP